MLGTDELIDRIVECDAKALELWESRVKRSVKHEDRLRAKIRRIHELEEAYFIQLWEALEDLDDFEEIERRNYEGYTRYIFCNGLIHLETTKKGKFKFGTLCQC